MIRRLIILLLIVGCEDAVAPDTTAPSVLIAYPSNGADLKGLIKSAFYDPNPVIILEHKGLYWSKIKGTENAKTIEPDKNYIIPFGKGRIALYSDKIEKTTICIITYGMGVHWGLNAAKNYKGKVEIVDLILAKYNLQIEFLQ